MSEDLNQSTFLFPLRSNVNFFDTPNGYLSLIGRIKQASLLFDRLLFERGIYISSITNRGFAHSIENYSDDLMNYIDRDFRSTEAEPFFNFTNKDFGPGLFHNSKYEAGLWPVPTTIRNYYSEF